MSLKQKLQIMVGGFISGIINALFGAGGGLVAVSLLVKAGLCQKKAQATAICLILPLTVITCFSYYKQGNINLSASLKYIIPGVIGAIPGTFFLKKMPNGVLKKIFAVVMIASGIKLVMK